MWNPLLDEKNRLEAESGADYRARYGDDLMGTYVPTSIRKPVQLRYSWATPSEAVIKRLVEMSPLVEIGAGTGYWAKLITEAGGDIIAYDLDPAGHPRKGMPGDAVFFASSGTIWHSGEEAWFDVQPGGPEMAKLHADRTLFLCWPPYQEAMGHDAVSAYHEAGGQRVAYIGEGSSGCCGTDSMFALFGIERGYCSRHDGDDEDEDCSCLTGPGLFKQTDSMAVVQWEGLHDWFTIFERCPS